MKIPKSLPHLTYRMSRQLKERQEALAELRGLKRSLLAKDLAYWVIDTHNLLYVFMRSYCLSSLMGAYTGSGQRITNARAIRGFESALTFAVTTRRKSLKGKGPPWEHSQEPKWHSPKEVIRVLTDAGCSNARGVSAALSPAPAEISHWTKARNFLAHRNARTAIEVRKVGIHYRLGLPQNPVTVMAALNTTGDKMIVEEWFEETGKVVSALPR